MAFVIDTLEGLRSLNAGTNSLHFKFQKEIGPNQMTLLAGAVNSNTTLTSLRIQSKQVGCESLKALSEGLRANFTVAS